MFKDLFFRISVKRRERIVQNQYRLSVAERSRQRKTRRLSAGEPDTAVSHNSLLLLFHLPDLLVEAYSLKPCPDVVIIPQEHVVLHAVSQKLRIMSKVTDNSAPLFLHVGEQLPAAVSQMTFIRIFAEETLSQRRFSACHRTGDADDLAWFRGEGNVLKDRIAARISEGEMVGSDYVFSATVLF